MPLKWAKRAPVIIMDEWVLTDVSCSSCLSEAEVEKHLQDTSGKEGQSCTLSCQLSIPNVQAQWFKNGKQLELKGKFTSEVKHKIQKLLISDLKPEDQGRYTCQYQNLQSSADLWVEGLYLEIILKPSRRAGCYLGFLLTSSTFSIKQ